MSTINEDLKDIASRAKALQDSYDARGIIIQKMQSEIDQKDKRIGAVANCLHEHGYDLFLEQTGKYSLAKIGGIPISRALLEEQVDLLKSKLASAERQIEDLKHSITSNVAQHDKLHQAITDAGFTAVAYGDSAEIRLERVGYTHDDLAVDSLADAMKAKLQECRKTGWAGWDSVATKAELSRRLHANAQRGDAVDVANYAAFLYARKQAISPPENVIVLTPQEVQSGLDRVKWAEGLISQLPLDHDGRNSWLRNYAQKPWMGVDVGVTVEEFKLTPDNEPMAIAKKIRDEFASIHDLIQEVLDRNKL